MAHTAKLNFYGDTPTERNKLFSFNVNNEADAKAGVKRFEKEGIHIRAAYFTIYENTLIRHSKRIK